MYRLDYALAARRQAHMSTPRLDRHLPPTMSIEPTRLLYSRSMQNELTFQDLELPQYEWFKCSAGTEADLHAWSTLRLDRLLAVDTEATGVGGPFGIPNEFARTIFAVHAIAQQSTLRFARGQQGSAV